MLSNMALSTWNFLLTGVHEQLIQCSIACPAHTGFWEVGGPGTCHVCSFETCRESLTWHSHSVRDTTGMEMGNSN